LSEDKKTEVKVIKADEVKADIDGIKADMAELKSQMDSDRESTGLKADERHDDFVKYTEVVDSIAKRMDDHSAKVDKLALEASFGTGDGELKDALDTFRAGFDEFDGDNEAREREIGAKPSIKHLVEGVFTKLSDDPDDEMRQFHAPRHIKIRRLQKAADDVYIVDAMMRAQMDDQQKHEYERAGGMRSLKTFRRFEAISGDFVKATSELIDTATEVANWLPTQYSANLYEQVKIGLPLLNLFPEVAMTAQTMELPLDLNDHEAMRVTETTDSNDPPYTDGDHMNPSALASNKITASAEKLRARYWISREAEEDTIVAMLPLLNKKMRRGMGEAIEDAIINGQITGNIDTAGTHFSKSNPPASSDARDCWDGLRYHFQQYAGSPATRASGGNVAATVTAMRALRAAMGEYGVDPAMVVQIFSPFGYVTLLDDDDLMTVDKFGPQATVRTGTLAQADGMDVLVSRRIPENANASGIIDNVTTNRTLALLAYTEGALLFNRRRITMATQDHIAQDSRELVAFWRGDFQPVYPAASVPWGGELYNIAAA